MPLPIGTCLGPYKILAPIGAGGMGEVYRALDTRLERTVAIKVLSAEFVGDPERKRRLIREAKAASALNHANIVQIYDVGSCGSTDFITMEYVAGRPLSEAIGPDGLDLRQAIRLAVQIAAALAKAHAAGITHRDLKPANLMITDDGSVKLLDFGLAKVTENTFNDDRTLGHVPATQMGTILGTVDYMSPEQAAGRPVDARSDIFSFGVVLYEMITGRRPFSGDSALATLAAILREEPTPPSQLRPALSAALEAILSRCLRKDPASRWQHMDEVKAALDGVLAHRQDPSESETDAAPAIAVLPFANLSPDKDNEYFSDGLAEEILNSLTQLPGLRVIARTSAFAFRGGEQTLPQIGEKLKVQNVLQGSVRRAGNRIRITAQLVRVADESQLWSERYDRELTDVFGIQDEIAQAIVGKLRVKLGGEPGRPLLKRYTDNLEAHSLYLRGVFHLYRLTAAEMEKGRRYLEQAVVLEPEYAPAWVELAHHHFARAFTSVGAPRLEMPKALESARRAVAADGGLADAHAVLALLEAFYEFRWSDALRRSQAALRLNPASPRACWWHGCILWPLGRLDEALAATSRALELDPLSALVHLLMALIHSWNERHDQAADHAQQAVEIDPDFGMGYAALGHAYSCMGRFDEGIALLEKARRLVPGEYWVTGYLGAAYARGSRRSDAERLLADLEASRRRQYISGAAIAIIAAALGEADRAFSWLETAVEDRDPELGYLVPDPHFRPLHPDPRYENILRRINLPLTP